MVEAYLPAHASDWTARFLNPSFASALISLVFPGVLFSQSGDISGVVRLQGGLGIGGAKVSAACTPNTTDTDEHGAFTLSGVSQGCRLAVAAEGFETATYIVNRLAQPVDVVIATDRLRQSVTVLASSPLVNSNPEISTAIDMRTLSQLPSSTRDINRFAMLDPRVRNTGSLGTDGIYGTRLAANGQLFRFTQYQMDGLSNYEPALGNGPQQVLSIASVAEYKLLVNQYGAEFGRSSGGIISAITRTGGDTWHGEVFCFLRPSGMQAAPPLSRFRVPNERHMWGGAAGGPLKRSWHAFASLEGNQQTRGAYIQSPGAVILSGAPNAIFWTGELGLASERDAVVLSKAQLPLHRRRQRKRCGRGL